MEGIFYVNHNLESLMFDELKASCQTGQVGGFLPGMKQIANAPSVTPNMRKKLMKYCAINNF